VAVVERSTKSRVEAVSSATDLGVERQLNEVRYREAERRLWESVGVTPTEQRLHLGRTGVTVRVQEVGQGPSVVFVHGASNCGTSWAPLVARLDGFRCVMLDGRAVASAIHSSPGSTTWRGWARSPTR
jgi:hypothetical protein